MDSDDEPDAKWRVTETTDNDVPSETRVLKYTDEFFDPKNWLNFIHSTTFQRAWKKLGLNDDNLRALEVMIMVDPSGPPVIQDTGGVRKIRFASSDGNKGKSGGYRVWYVYYEEYGVILLQMALSKSSSVDISDQVKKQLKEYNRRQKQRLAGGSPENE